MSAPTTPELISNNAINNNPLPTDEQNTIENQQESPFQYRPNSPSTSLISDAFPPHPVNVPPIDNDTMTIPLQHNQQQMVANKAGWTTQTKNAIGNNVAFVGNNTGTGEVGGKVTPPRGSICIMTPCSNSHPFEERRILVTRSEENAVKIGRSVVRLQPATNNAIFDCKVLSRNHALLWQTNDGQFVIKDTRSSNGTFINNERLSASGEESGPKELFSGDILQLGVEIVDNTKKVASGCITCIVRLINEQGEEYAARPQGDPFSQLQIRNEQQIPMNYTLVRNDKFFMLEQYIKEAKFRENLLGQKLQILEEQLSGAQDSLKNKWDEHIKQELLLSRIELLESQLGFFTNNKKASTSNAENGGEDATEGLKKEMQELMEDRAKAEQIAKETLRAKLEQIHETSMRLHDAEMSLMNLEEECALLRQRCADYEDKQQEVVVPAGHSSTDFQASTSNAENGGEDAVERLKKEMQELMEDRAKAEQIAKETLRATLEQMQETSMRLHDAEMNLENLEKECALLRQRCADYEDDKQQEVVVPAGHSSTDFQVFILSTLPFLLIIMLIFSPAFYFFGPSSTTAPTNMDENPIDSLDENLLELDEAKEDKKENDD